MTGQLERRRSRLEAKLERPTIVAQAVQLAWFNPLAYWRKLRNLDSLRYSCCALLSLTTKKKFALPLLDNYNSRWLGDFLVWLTHDERVFAPITGLSCLRQ